MNKYAFYHLLRKYLSSVQCSQLNLLKDSLKNLHVHKIHWLIICRRCNIQSRWICKINQSKVHSFHVFVQWPQVNVRYFADCSFSLHRQKYFSMTTIHCSMFGISLIVQFRCTSIFFFIALHLLHFARILFVVLYALLLRGTFFSVAFYVYFSRNVSFLLCTAMIICANIILLLSIIVSSFSSE